LISSRRPPLRFAIEPSLYLVRQTILPVVRAAKASGADEIFKHDLARPRLKPEEPRRLFQVESQAGHFAVRSRNHRLEVRAGRFSRGDTVVASPFPNRSVDTHRPNKKQNPRRFTP
jgi:hypothetical protein